MSYGFRASLNFRLATKYLSLRIALIAPLCRLVKLLMDVVSSSGSRKFTSLFRFMKIETSEFRWELIRTSSIKERLSEEWLLPSCLRALAASLAGDLESALLVLLIVDILVNSDGFFADVGLRGAFRWIFQVASLLCPSFCGDKNFCSRFKKIYDVVFQQA